MITPARPVYSGQIPDSPPGLAGWWDDISGSVSDAIGRFSTAGATRIIAQPGTTVTTRTGDSSTTISRAGTFNPTTTFGVGLDVPAVRETSTGTIFVLAALGIALVLVLNRR